MQGPCFKTRPITQHVWYNFMCTSIDPLMYFSSGVEYVRFVIYVSTERLK